MLGTAEKLSIRRLIEAGQRLRGTGASSPDLVDAMCSIDDYTPTRSVHVAKVALRAYTRALRPIRAS